MGECGVWIPRGVGRDRVNSSLQGECGYASHEIYRYFLTGVCGVWIPEGGAIKSNSKWNYGGYVYPIKLKVSFSGGLRGMQARGCRGEK